MQNAQTIKKILALLILIFLFLPFTALAQETGADGDADATEEQTADGEGADAESPPKKEAVCKFEKITKTPECLTDEERENFQYTVLEEAISISGDVEEYGSQGSFAKPCQRMIQIENCSSDTEKPLVKSSTKFVKKGACTSEGYKGSNSRVICEDITMLMAPLKSGGAGLLNTYIGLIYRWAAGIVGVIAVLIIIINSVLIITAGGDQGGIDEAKKRIFQSLGGIAILFLSSLILYVINPDFFKL